MEQCSAHMNETLRGINIKAVILGFLADIGSTFVFGFAFGLLASLLLISSGEDLQQLLEFAKSPVFRTVMPIAGLLFTVLGGYVTARAAGKNVHAHALLMGIASSLFGVGAELLSPSPAPIWLTAISVALTILCALLGAYVYDNTRVPDRQNSA